MLPIPSWANEPIEKLTEALAKRAVLVRRLQLSKTANDPASFFQGLGQRVLSDPSMRHALMGAGAGALLGGASSFGRGRKSRQPLRSALTGALAGGALAGGASLIGRTLPETQLAKDLLPFRSKGPAIPKIPSSLAEDTSLPSKLQELQTPSAIARGYDSLKGFIADHPLLSGLVGADVATQAAKPLFRVRPSDSTDPKRLMEAVRALGNKGSKTKPANPAASLLDISESAKKQLGAIASDRDAALKFLRELREGKQPSGTLPPSKLPPASSKPGKLPDPIGIPTQQAAEVSPQTLKRLIGEENLPGYRGYSIRGLLDRIQRVRNYLTNSRTPATSLTAVESPLPAFSVSPTRAGRFKNWLFRERGRPAAPLKSRMMGGGLKRLLAYGGLYGAQHLLDAYKQETSRQEQLKKLLEEAGLAK